MKIVCRKCKYEWDYKGSGRRISCSKCKTSITIDNQNHKAEVEIVRLAKPIVVNSNPSMTAVKLTPALFKDARLAQRIYGLKATGDEYVILKVGDDGVLCLM